MGSDIDERNPNSARKQRFHATVIRGGKTATGIQVPEEVVAALGSGKKPPVRVTINGYTYRTTVAVFGGEYFIPLSAEHRSGAGTAAGEVVEVGMELDTQPREVSVPPDFAGALERDAEAGHRYESLSYSSKRRVILSIEDAKTPETRLRRIDKAIAMLKEGKA